MPSSRGKRRTARLYEPHRHRSARRLDRLAERRSVRTGQGSSADPNPKPSNSASATGSRRARSAADTIGSGVVEPRATTAVAARVQPTNGRSLSAAAPTTTRRRSSVSSARCSHSRLLGDDAELDGTLVHGHLVGEEVAQEGAKAMVGRKGIPTGSATGIPTRAARRSSSRDRTASSRRSVTAGWRGSACGPR